MIEEQDEYVGEGSYTKAEYAIYSNFLGFFRRSVRELRELEDKRDLSIALRKLHEAQGSVWDALTRSYGTFRSLTEPWSPEFKAQIAELQALKAKEHEVG